MTVVIPYTDINPLVKEVIKREVNESGFKYVFIKMERNDSYWKLLCNVWENRQPVIIIEHDIMPWPGALKELASCPSQWCSYTYKMKEGYGIHHAFGCTKFGADFMDSFPDVWAQVDTTMWNTLDAQLCEIAKREGLTPHPHRPPVIHCHGIV